MTHPTKEDVDAMPGTDARKLVILRAMLESHHLSEHWVPWQASAPPVEIRGCVAVGRFAGTPRRIDDDTRRAIEERIGDLEAKLGEVAAPNSALPTQTKEETMNDLNELARRVVGPMSSGSQQTITIDVTGRTFDTDRKIRVSQDANEEEDGHPSMTWEGGLDEWIGAVQLAALSIRTD